MEIDCRIENLWTGMEGGVGLDGHLTDWFRFNKFTQQLRDFQAPSGGPPPQQYQQT